jgi:hypothetical protein
MTNPYLEFSLSLFQRPDKHKGSQKNVAHFSVKEAWSLAEWGHGPLCPVRVSVATDNAVCVTLERNVHSDLLLANFSTSIFTREHEKA